MDQTLKKPISQLCQEGHFKGADVLPSALMRVRIAPQVRGVSPLETFYGNPYPAGSLEPHSAQMHVKGEGMLRNHLLSLSSVLTSLHRFLSQQVPLTLDFPSAWELG